MSDLKSVKIIYWSGKEEDWTMWSTKFKMRGIARGYGDVLTGDKTVKTDDEIAMIADDDLKKDELGMQKSAREGYMELIMSMQDIKSFNIVKEHENNLYDAWLALQDEFEPTTPEALIEEIEEYNESKLHDAKTNVGDWLTELELKRQRLKVMGYDINDQMFMTHILSSLPKEYVVMTTDLYSLLVEKKLNVKELKLKLKRVFKALKKANNWTGEETALYSNETSKDDKTNYKFKKRFKGMCNFCGKQGHKAVDCWEREENKSKRPNNWKNGPNNWKNGNNGNVKKVTCFLCGEQGHKVFNCPKNPHSAKCMQENETSAQEHLLICEDAKTDNISQKDYDVLCEDIWIADSGATSHMTNNRDGMYDIEEYNSSVKVGNGKNISITHKGKLDVLIMQKDGKRCFSTLTNVKLIPELGHSLFSIQALLMKGWMTSSEKANNPINQIPKIVHEKMNDVKFDRIVRAGDSVLTGLKMIRRQHYNNLTADQRRTINRDKWHAMLGHCGESVGNTTAKVMGIELSGKLQKCEHCVIEKIRKKNIPKNVEYTIEKPGELMYLDISSMKQASGGGNKHWILLVDRATDFKISWFVKKKNDQIEVVSKFLSNLKASNNIQVKYIRLDNSGENKALEQECLRLGLGIQFEYTAPGTPQQNGVVERSFPT